MLGNQVSCPKCNHQRNLLNADSTHFTCSNCKHFVRLHDATFTIKINDDYSKYADTLVLGDEYRHEDGQVYTLTGKLVKRERVDKDAIWTEYSFINEKNQNFFLSEYNGHWNVIKNVETFNFLKEKPNNNIFNAIKNTVYIDGKSYNLWHRYHIIIIHVEGEFNFNPFEDDGTLAIEFINKKRLCIVEFQSEQVKDCYRGTYAFASQIKRGFFRKLEMPKQIGYAGNQPFYWDWDLSVFRGMSILVVFLMFLLVLFLKNTESYSKVSDYHLILETLDSVAGREELYNMERYKTFISSNFDIKNAHGLLEVGISCPNLSNDWVGAEMSLVNNQTDEVRYFVIETEYYTGSDSDGAWSEGGRSNSGTVENVPKGNYHLEIQPIQQLNAIPKEISISIKETRGSWGLFFLFAAILLIFSFLLWLWEDYFYYEKGADSAIDWAGENNE